MAQPIGGLSVYFEDDNRFAQTMLANAALTEQAANRMKRATGGVATGLDQLNAKASSFAPDPFKRLALSALQANTGVERLQRSLLAITALAGGGFGGAFAFKALADAADQYQRINNRIAAVIPLQRARVAAEQDVFDISQKTRSSYEATNNLFTRLVLSSSTLGANNAQIARVTETVQKSLAVGGATPGEAASVATQLSQALASGRLQGDELRSILENAPSLALALAKAFNVSVGELKAMGTEGKLLSSDVFKAILNSGEAIDQQFADMKPTIAQALTVFDNAFTRYIGRADQSLGASNALAKGILDLSNNMDSLGSVATYAAAAVASVFIGRSTSGAVGRGVGAVKGEINSRQAAASDAASVLGTTKAEAASASEEAAQRRREAYIRAENAAAAREQVSKSTIFDQAGPKAQDAVFKANAGLTDAQAKLGAAQSAQTDLLNKRIAKEAEVAEASVASRNAAARAAEMDRIAEERLNAALERRLMLEGELRAAGNAGAANPSRAQNSAVYKALFDEANARDTLKSNVGARLDNRDALRDAREAVHFAPDDGARNTALGRVNQLEAEAKKIADERVSANQRFVDSRRALDKVEQDLSAATVSNQEKVAAAYAKSQAAVDIAADRASETSRRSSEKQKGVADSIVAAEERKATQLAAIDNKIVDAQANVARRRANVAGAESGVGSAVAALTPASLVARARVDAEMVNSQVALGAAKQAEQEIASAGSRSVAAASENASAAASKVGVASSAAGVAIRGLMSAGSGLVAFLGGPWGVAFTAAIAGFALWEIQSAKAAAVTKEYQDAVDGASESVKRLSEAQNVGMVNSAALAARQSQSKITAGNDRTMDSLLGDKPDPEGDALSAQMGAIINRRQGALADLEQSLSGKISPQAIAQIDQLRENLQKARDTGGDTKAAVDALLDALTALGANGSDAIQKLVGPLVAMLGLLRNALGAASAIPSALDAATARIETTGDSLVVARQRREEVRGGKLIDQQISIPPLGPTPDVVTEQVRKEVLAAADKKGDATRTETMKRAVELQNGAPGTMTVPEAMKLARDEEKLKDSQKGGGGGKKSDAEKFEDALEKLQQQGGASFFSETDKAMIDKLTQMKGSDPELIKRTREAVMTNSPLPAEAQQVRDAILLQESGKLYNQLLEKYGTFEQIAPRVAAQQQIINTAVEKGKLSADAAGGAMADYLSKFQNFKWIDQTADAISNGLSGALEGAIFKTQSLSDAALGLAKSIAKIGIDEFLTMPLRNFLRSNLAAGATGGGGGFFGSILSSLGLGGSSGGSGASSAGKTAGATEIPVGGEFYHEGGDVGIHGDRRGLFPASVFSSAPRFHTGIKSDELAAVLQRSERVLTARQTSHLTNAMSAMTDMASGGGGQEVHVYPPSGFQTSTSKSSAGGKQRLDITFAEMIEADVAAGGGGSKSLERMYGLSRLSGR